MDEVFRRVTIRSQREPPSHGEIMALVRSFCVSIGLMDGEESYSASPMREVFCKALVLTERIILLGYDIHRYNWRAFTFITLVVVSKCVLVDGLWLKDCVDTMRTQGYDFDHRDLEITKVQELAYMRLIQYRCHVSSMEYATYEHFFDIQSMRLRGGIPWNWEHEPDTTRPQRCRSCPGLLGLSPGNPSSQPQGVDV